MIKQQRLTLVVCILASFVAFLDGSIVNVALPAIARNVHGGLALQQWIVDAYTITLGSLMLVAGAFSDIFGRKKIMRLGLLSFALTSVLCAIAPNGGVLIVARALQGVAGALLVPSSLALLMSVFSGRLQGKAIGIWTAWTGIAFIVGPLLGGILVDIWSWRLIFAVNVLPIALTLVLLGSVRIEERPQQSAHVDVLGVILAGMGLGGPVYALIEQQHFGWTSALIYGPLVAGLSSLVLFVWHERRTAFPMVPLRLFAVRNFAVGNAATVLIYGAVALAVFIVTIFLQQVAGYSALHAGLALLPVTLVMFVLSGRVGELASRFGPRWFMAGGPLIVAIGFVSMLRIGSTAAYWTEVFPGALLFGLGFSATVAPLTTAVLGSIDTERAGTASAISNAVSRIAGLISVAVAGILAGEHITLTGFHHALIAIALLMAGGGIISAIGISNSTKPDTTE